VAIQYIGDSDPGCLLVGSWLQSGSSGAFNGGFHYAADDTTGSNTATWTFSVTAGAKYRVSATWGATANRATNAPFAVLDGGTTLGTAAIDQQLAPATFAVSLILPT